MRSANRTIGLIAGGLVLVLLVIVGVIVASILSRRPPDALSLTGTAIAVNPQNANADIPLTPNATLLTPGTLPPGVTLSPGATAPACYFGWATQELPELTATVQTALEQAGIPNITVRAYDFGENCYSSESDQVVYFARRETDYDLTLQVASLDDDETLGNLISQILVMVRDNAPMGDELPGYITVVFQSGDQERRLRFTGDQAANALSQGITGAALMQTLNPPA